MFPFADIIQITLQNVAASVFDFTFIFVIFIMYMLYKKNTQMLSFSLVVQKINVRSQIIEATLQGILAGILGSFIVISLGLPISFSPYLTLLLPIAIILSLINIRYLCFSYSASILGLIAIVLEELNSLGLNVPQIKLDVSGLIALVAVLHLMESVLIFFGGADDHIPIVVRKNGKVAVGFLMQKFWPLPFALLILQVGMSVTGNSIQMPDWWPLLKNNIVGKTVAYSIIPITVALGYGNVALSVLPEKKARQSALKLFLYSVFLIIISILSVNNMWLKILGIILMPLLHEAIIVMEQKKENKLKPIYTLPEKGVRVVSLIPDGHGEKMGLKQGDIIRKINDIEVINYNHMRVILNNYYTFLWIEVERLNGEVITLEYKAYPSGINNLNIIHLPKYPGVTYNLDEMQNNNMFNIFRRRRKK